MFTLGFALGSENAVGVAQDSLVQVFDFTSGTLPAGINFARNSPATQFDSSGDLVQITNDVPRFSNDPVNLQSSGLLIETESTNILPHAVVTRNDWSRSGATVVDLSLNALGYFPGVSIISGGQNWHRILDHTSLLANQPYAVTMLYRSGSSGKAAVTLKDGTSGKSSSVSGNVGQLAAGSSAAGPVTQITETLLYDGLTCLCTFIYTPNFSGPFNIGFGPNSKTAGEDVILLGIQMEPANTTSSLILTNGSTTVRAPDQIGFMGLSGVHDILVTYDDDSQDMYPAQTISDGYWPEMSRTIVKRIDLTKL